MKCKCSGSILQKSSDGGFRVRIHGPISISPDGLAKSKCFWCREEITLPLELKKGSVASPEGERFILAPKKKT